MDMFRKIKKARMDHGKPAWKQVLEAMSLRLAKLPVGIGEYFEYGIYRQEVSPAKVREFIGWRESLALDKSLNADYSRVLANDKLLNYLVLHAAGLPIPEPIASFSTSGRRIAHELVLNTIDDVRRFLNGDHYPFYVKPISSGYGKGVLGVRSKEGNNLRLLDDSFVSIDDFLKPFSFAPFCGMLFQKPLIAHPTISALTGSPAVCCVRFICFITPKGPVIHTAFWKVTAGKNMLDNFTHGEFGNCLASIDIDSGVVVRAIEKLGPGGKVDCHPTTGKPLIGFALPDWGRAVALVCSASKHFPGLHLQNWDVALCPEGPVLLELNTESELAVPQAISGHGLKDERLRKIQAEIASGEEIQRQQLASGPKKVLVTIAVSQHG
jgi:hypothetical protein